MEKTEIINDTDYIRKCSEYRLDWQDFKIYKNVIMLNTPKRDVYVLLDENYNTIGVHNVDNANGHLTKSDIAERYWELYNHVDVTDGCSFLYPFQDFSLKQLEQLSNRVEIHEVNHGHSSNVIVNGKLINGEQNEDYIALLSYIKFLSCQINQYFLNAYHMKTLGFDYPDVYSYVRSLMQNINECIKQSIANNRTPNPADIMEYIGLDRKSSDGYISLLYNIIYFYLKENTDEPSKLSNNLLKLLEVTSEEVNKQIEENKKNFHIETIDLKSWIEDKNTKEKTTSLKKTE